MAKTYASNLAGTCLLAYDEWTRARKQFDEPGVCDAEREVLATQARVYARIVRHITGRDPGWFVTRQDLTGTLDCIA